MVRRRHRNRVGVIQHPIHVHHHRRRHRRGLRRQLADMLVVRQARAIPDRGEHHDGQHDNDDGDLAAKRLGQGLRANGISV